MLEVKIKRNTLSNQENMKLLTLKNQIEMLMKQKGL